MSEVRIRFVFDVLGLIIESRVCQSMFRSVLSGSPFELRLVVLTAFVSLIVQLCFIAV